MKTVKLLLLITILATFFVVGSNAQTQAQDTTKAKTEIQIDKDGNIVAIKTGRTSKEPQATGKTYTHTNGQTYPLWKGQKGGYFVYRTSKRSGKQYKYYLPKELKTQLDKLTQK